MVGVIRALVSGALLGAVIGVVARLLMRLVALVAGDEPAFTWGASLAIVGLFVVSAAGAAAAATLASRRWLAALVVLATSFPVLLMGTAIGLGEVVAVEAEAHDLAAAETGGQAAERTGVLVDDGHRVAAKFEGAGELASDSPAADDNDVHLDPRRLVPR